MQLTEIKKFQIAYPALYTLLSSYFADNEDLSDSKVIDNFIDEEDYNEVKDAIANAKAFFKKYQENIVGFLSNKFFEDDNEEKIWFENIIKLLDKKFKEI